MKEYAVKRKALEEKEFKNLGQLYSELSLKILLRLVEIFTSAAKCSSHPLSMVQRIANAYRNANYILKNYYIFYYKGI